jgi:hypothetical protein
MAMESVEMAKSMNVRDIAYSTCAGWLMVGASSLMRWKGRCASGLDPVMKPGPAKAVAPDMAVVRRIVEGLRHGRKRTAGTTALARKLSDCMSRRDFAAMVRSTRKDAREAERSAMERVTWESPGLVWAMDETETGDGFILQVRELATNAVLLAESRKTCFHGADVAAALGKLFARHGAPSVLKRDNGSALKASEVEAVLAENIVVAFDSPPYWPKYNGLIENAQNELKGEMEAIRPPGCGMDCPVLAECASHRLNHKPRRMLKKACSCHVLGSKRVKRNRLQRRSMHYEIAAMEVEIGDSGSIFGKAAIRRSAIVSWLLSEGHISVARGKKVSAGFLRPELSLSRV